MTTLLKKAWLIGLYTVDLDARIEELGYTIDDVFSSTEIPKTKDHPDLIVITEDPLNDYVHMMTEMHVRFPEALIVSLSVSSFFLEDCLIYNSERSSKRSVARLVTKINEMEHRWDN